ncbi:hypothetical protein AQS8620_01644 [Aquimixticola soesokkakensis]|uniref:DUF6456 domain-containing protein n=1 Tax=Aquimixticola soesokkakensis TaxID=1519096 RepID=A0A1Y5SKQ3_9RHOB|nr:DUF6456 domain-containing protein [Aquimixticola soesokkakensis]SLN41834.1 hypothetical protein AQS8620_01644 [Aquimixticola soesokkakensis]
MANTGTHGGAAPHLPNWVPSDARHYLEHTEAGLSIRELARNAGVHASTVMRQVRKFEAKRDDPLIDEALTHLGRMADVVPRSPVLPAPSETPTMSPKPTFQHKTAAANEGESPVSDAPDDATIEREARRVLRRLSEVGACLAVAKDMEKAVVVRDLPDGRTTRTAVLDRPIAQAMALKDWITAKETGRITRYFITQAGRAALKRFVAAEESARAGFAEAPAKFGDQHREWGERDVAEDGRPKRQRYNMAESPVLGLARRRDKDGAFFLEPELVAAAERLREDFELAQMGPRVTQNWDKFLTGGDRGSFQPNDARGFGPQAARDRVAVALAELGPGLGDVALRCCCYLEGLEQAEKQMNWAARSGKIVLRIALQRLKRHYDAAGYSNLIG